MIIDTGAQSLPALAERIVKRLGEPQSPKARTA